MSLVLDVPVQVLHPADGVAGWVFLLIGTACALALLGGWFAGLWRRNRYRAQIGYRLNAPKRPYRNHDDEQEAGERRIAQG